MSTFLNKLLELLSKGGFCWSACGNYFKINEEIILEYSNISTFCRRLNEYNFKQYDGYYHNPHFTKETQNIQNIISNRNRGNKRTFPIDSDLESNFELNSESNFESNPESVSKPEPKSDPDTNHKQIKTDSKPEPKSDTSHKQIKTDSKHCTRSTTRNAQHTCNLCGDNDKHIILIHQWIGTKMIDVKDVFNN